VHLEANYCFNFTFRIAIIFRFTKKRIYFCLYKVTTIVGHRSYILVFEIEQQYIMVLEFQFSQKDWQTRNYCKNLRSSHLTEFKKDHHAGSSILIFKYNIGTLFISNSSSA